MTCVPRTTRSALRGFDVGEIEHDDLPGVPALMRP
jgi:hypothetical protein